ncbi:MAG: hypothetical protein FWE95_01745 [Planctomycetaceae bacterium]|nr:hypothetical protein [Planctomycetaceae bacterium]
MTHELILTSVAQGLDPKDYGFCPVAKNLEIIPRVIGHLTALSNYRYLIAETGDLSPQSPVVYSHLILPGGLEYVLSRVAGIGTDYKGRPNVLAHHVVLENMDCPAESPAWLLALPGFHFSEWKAPPIRFTHGRPIPTLTNPPSLTRRQQIARQYRWLDPQKMAPTGTVDIESESHRTSVHRNDEQIILAAPPTTPCPVWQELTGDPGWGGVLAETALTGQPVVLIYNPEQNILPLFVEALALLPEFLAWRTTFCTYYTELPNEISCQWKGVVAGSEETVRLSRDLHSLIIDLTVPMGEPLTGCYVDFARFGHEHLLPLDLEEETITNIAANADTKSDSDTKRKKEKASASAGTVPIPDKEPSPVPSKIQLPPKHGGVLELLLRRSSRSQFYLLYSIMFVLVLFLLFLAIDQVGDFGIVQKIRNWNQPPPIVEPPDMQNQQPPPENISDLDTVADPEHIEQDILVVPEDIRKTFAELRAQQKEPLLLFWKDFVVPEFLAINFPNVENHQIDIPEKKLFAELQPLYENGVALELRFIPLFEMPSIRVETTLVIEALPDLVWLVSAVDTVIDNEANLATPMFLFQLTAAGLEMEWQPKGLTNQYLYDTILTSLGFLELSIVGTPETAVEIPLFAPVETVPMKVSDLATLAEQESPEHVIELPFASELWQEIFATMNPPYTLRLEVSAEPTGDWIRIESPTESEMHAEVLTTQQARKPAESGDTFENIKVTFVASASLENIVWKGDEYAERLLSEQDVLKRAKEQLERQIGRLDTQIFDGDQSARQERDEYRAELRSNDLRLAEIESLLERLPAAYREIGENESKRFHYSLFLESEATGRRLLILETVP